MIKINYKSNPKCEKFKVEYLKKYRKTIANRIFKCKDEIKLSSLRKAIFNNDPTEQKINVNHFVDRLFTEQIFTGDIQFVNEYVALMKYYYSCKSITNFKTNIFLIDNIDEIKEILNKRKVTNASARKVKYFIKKLDHVITKNISINYKNVTSEIRYNLSEYIDLDVCPYCNKNYIQSFKKGEKLYNQQQIDHFYPKSIYPLFALSLYNFIPSCSFCNAILKNDNSNSDDLIYPYNEEFGDDVVFILDNITNKERINVGYSINTTNTNKQKKITNSIQMFSIIEQYNSCNNYLNNLVRKKNNYTEPTKHKLKELLDIKSDDELNSLIYGTSFDDKEGKNIPLYKLTKDVINEEKS